MEETVYVFFSEMEGELHVYTTFQSYEDMVIQMPNIIKTDLLQYEDRIKLNYFVGYLDLAQKKCIGTSKVIYDERFDKTELELEQDCFDIYKLIQMRKESKNERN